MTLDEKIKDAEAVLKLAADMSKHYYDKPLIITYSGGKDSDVMLDIAKKCLNVGDFEVVNSHTTVDAPETVYHIREVFADLEAQGIHAEIRYPYYKGERTSMWKLIKDKGIPPTRMIRYCCEILKETSTPDRMAALGVREAESAKRQGRDAFAVHPKSGNNYEWRTLEHTFAMYQIDKTGIDGSYECEMIKACKEHKDTIVQPIYKFEDSDIWEYVKQNNVKMNPLYSKGYDRVGCIGCPLSSYKNMKKEFNDYPKYKENYIRAFDRMLEARRAKGNPFMHDEYQTGEEVMRWWLGENPKQVTFDDIIGG